MNEHEIKRQDAPATVKAKVSIMPVKIHGPNSDKPEGTREPIDADITKTVELTEAEVREQFGDEIADEWFGR